MKEKKVILMYEFLSEPGGLERLMINHANFLKQKGYDVKILTCHIDKKILSLLPFDNLKIENISVFDTGIELVNLILCFLGFNKLKKYSPDLFISYSFPCNFLIRNKIQAKINYVNHYPHFIYLNNKEKIEWASKTLGMKRWAMVILSFLFGRFFKKLDKKLIKKNTLILTNSKFTKSRIDSIYNIESVVNHPPLSPSFKPSKQIKERFIFSSGRIIPDKKYEWLISSLVYAKNNLPLYISGLIEDSYRSKLQNQAKNLGVKIKFLGRVSTEDLIKYYSSASVFAFPSPLEDFGLVPAESLACGTPVVAWGDKAGPAEQIINGSNGFLAKPYDLKDFARKLDLAIDSDLKRKNHKKILSSSRKFSYEKIKKEFLNHIKKVQA